MRTTWNIFVAVCGRLGHGWADYAEQRGTPKSATKALTTINVCMDRYNVDPDNENWPVGNRDRFAVENGKLVYNSPSRFRLEAGNDHVVVTIRSHALGDGTITISPNGEMVFATREGSWTVGELIQAWETWDGTTTEGRVPDWELNSLPNLPAAGHIGRAHSVYAVTPEGERLYTAVYAAFYHLLEKKKAAVA